MTEQVFHPYTAWEDWQAGMWRPFPAPPRDTTDRISQAAHILADPAVFAAAAHDMLTAWPAAAEHNLTNLGQNRRAWVGQAACCWLADIPETATRLAWWTLTGDEQIDANTVADTVIAEWETLRDTRHRPTLFVIDGGTPRA